MSDSMKVPWGQLDRSKLDASAPLDNSLWVFHYTDLNACIEILKTKRLWATGIYYLSDGAEIKYGLDLLNKQSSVDLDKWSKYLLDQIQVYQVYVTAFSKNQDKLSQWRAYAARGQGVSIGFHRQLFTNSKEGCYEISDCLYEKDEQLKLVDEVVELLEHHDSKKEKGPAHLFNHEVLKRLAKLKDPSFEEENEARAISGNYLPKSEEIKFRAGTFTVIPYVEFEFPEEALSTITVGPTPDMHRATKAIEQIANRYFKHPVNVFKSKIPYRQW